MEVNGKNILIGIQGYRIQGYGLQGYRIKNRDRDTELKIVSLCSLTTDWLTDGNVTQTSQENPSLGFYNLILGKELSYFWGC